MSGFSPFGSWEDFVSVVNLKGFAWKNLLGQDREEAFTPTLGGTATYTVQLGRYTKVGRQVFFHIDLAVTSIGTGSATVISGLPVVATTSDFICNVRANNCATAVVSVYGVVLNGTNTLRLASRTVASADDAFNAIFQDSSVVRVTGMYHSAT
jgi:hypothetical protein